METNHSEDARLLKIIHRLVLRFKLEGKEVEFHSSSFMIDRRKGKRIIREMEKRGLVVVEKDPQCPQLSKIHATPMAYDEIKEEWPDLCTKFDEASKLSPNQTSNKGVKLEALNNANLKWIVKHAEDYTVESWDIATESVCTTLTIGKESDSWHPMGSAIYVRDFALSEKIRVRTRQERINNIFKENLSWAIMTFAHVSKEDAKLWRIGEGQARWLLSGGYKVQTSLNTAIEDWGEDTTMIVVAARKAAQEASNHAASIERVNAAVTAIGGWKVLGEKLIAHVTREVDTIPIDNHLRENHQRI